MYKITLYVDGAQISDVDIANALKRQPVIFPYTIKAPLLFYNVEWVDHPVRCSVKMIRDKG